MDKPAKRRLSQHSWSTTCRCGYPLTVRVRTLPEGRQEAAYFPRDTQEEITFCPNCRRGFPKLTPDEFVRVISNST